MQASKRASEGIHPGFEDVTRSPKQSGEGGVQWLNKKELISSKQFKKKSMLPQPVCGSDTWILGFIVNCVGFST